MGKIYAVSSKVLIIAGSMFCFLVDLNPKKST